MKFFYMKFVHVQNTNLKNFDKSDKIRPSQLL